MLLRKNLLLAGVLVAIITPVIAQRSYKPRSVLASGNFYLIAIKDPGIYKIDIPFLNKLGISTGNLASSGLRLYGNGGKMLNESNSGEWTDDLEENALMVVDEGDGFLNGNDYALFFASGADQWLKDSVNQGFHHQKNLYSDKTYYYLTVGGDGKRIVRSPGAASPNVTINSFSARFVHELDTVNFLSSGKEWYGEEFSNLPGRSLTRSFAVSIPNILTGANLSVRTNCIARSVGAGSNFDVKVNNNFLQQISVPPVGTGQYDRFAQEATATASTNATQNDITVAYSYNPGSFNAQGWLNWFEIFSRARLSLNGVNQLLFRDWTSVGNNTGEFVISDAKTTTQVWDVTDPLTPLLMQQNFSGGELRFVNSCSSLREYIAFNDTDLPVPEPEGKIANQDLHGAAPTDHIIVVHPPFLAQAQRLAQFHRQHNGLRTLVVTTQQVYNEFSSGTPDPTAIRDFVKMYYDKFKDPADKLKYLLLFGDASYDYKDRLLNNTNYVPSYQNNVSLDILSTYTTDDFFGFLDDTEDINSGSIVNYLDIGVGRVPAKNTEEATNFVDKVEAYYNPSSFGPWRNNFTFIADDEDQNLHLQDMELVTGTVSTTAPVFDKQKIYLDAYRQETGSGGSAYPSVNQAINNQVLNGTLIWNFAGHGGPRRLAEETILDQQIVNSWKNVNRLPLFITATCDFAPFDNPLLNSLGENILVRPKTGAIALMTTTRVVFAFSNRIMNNNYLQIALQTGPDGRYRALGDAVKDAKNYTYQTSSDIANNRKFTLLGDPAVTIAYPVLKVQPTKINGTPATAVDTLSAAEKVIIEGEVRDVQGNLLTGFNGNVYPVVYDKPQNISTLGNDPTSPPTSFSTQSNILFKGKASVTGGKFSFSFKVPRDINYQYGNGKLSLYAENGANDGNGYYTGFMVGGSGNDVDNDKEGPVIKPFLNDEKFVNGGITNEMPVLILKLSDSSGINTSSTGIGHDLVATLDDDDNQFFILNEFFQADLNSYQLGRVSFQLPELKPGPHRLKVKAWDVLNNSSEAILEFIVEADEELQISHVLNYPNPFTTRTQFWFEHNKPGLDLQVRLQIFTVTGRVIKTFQKTINTIGNRSSELEWDGKDEYGDKVAKGVYLYKLSVTAPNKLRKEKIEKLVLF